MTEPSNANAPHAPLLTPDLCVIGAGAAGLSVAATAAALGVPVVLIERGLMGGDCLNVGCVPSKALLAAGHAAQAMRQASVFGVTGGEPRIDFAAALARVRAVIAGIAPLDSVERFRALGVTVIQGEARFTDARTVSVGQTMIRARRFVLATGSRPAIPPIEGLSAVPYLTNETVFDIPDQPRHLAVIGAGPIGAELAQAFVRLGVPVTLIDVGPFLGREDPELSQIAAVALQRDGVVIRDNAAIMRVEGTAGDIRIVLGQGVGRPEEQVSASHLLVATGRRANVEGIGLDLAGVAIDKRGIVVDRGLRTTNRRIYAIGDCAGGAAGPYRFTHVSGYHASLVTRSALFRLPVRLNDTAIPRVTYTDPEVAAVGLGEDEARAAGHTVRILRFPFAENDRARTEGQTAGHVKIIADKRGRVLGAGIVGPHAGELIVLWTLLVRKNMQLRDVIETVFPYPTLSEAARRAAVNFLAPSASSGFVRGLIRFLRRFG